MDPGKRMELCDPIGVVSAESQCNDAPLIETQPGIPITFCGAVQGESLVIKHCEKFEDMISNAVGDCPVIMHSLVKKDTSDVAFVSPVITLENLDAEDYTVHLR